MTKSPTHTSLTRRERQIMDALYRRGRATAAEARGDLPGEPNYPTVRTQLRVLEDDRKVTKDLFHQLLADELPKVKTYLGAAAYAAGKYAEGAQLFERITTDDNYVEFLTLPAYELID